MSELKTILQQERFQAVNDWPSKTLEISKDEVEQLDSTGSSSTTFRIKSGIYRGNVLKLMKLPDDDADELTSGSDTFRNILQTKRNAEALTRINSSEESQIPKLIDRGIYDGTLATVETFMPDILGNRKIIPTMRGKSREDRLAFYKSTAKLFLDLKENGVIPQDANNDFAFHNDNSSGMIDFGSAYILNSEYNTTTEQKAESNGCGSLVSLIAFVEDMVDHQGYQTIKERLRERPENFEELQKLIDSLD